MLTKRNITQFTQYLENTLIVCHEMMQSREIDRLFTSEKDYRDSEIASKIVPCEYYRIRLFDVEIDLNFNSRTKQYFIKVDTFKKLPFSIRELNKQFKNGFEKFTLDGCPSFYIDKDLPFDKTVLLFEEFVRWYLYLINKNNIGFFEDIF